ncbi:MAG: DoxX family protein [bacterium]|nr:DoxX family protein [bacterium]
MIPSLLVFSDYGILALRLVLGAILVAHGWPKLRNIAAVADTLRAMGFRPARVWAVVAGTVEFFGGLLIIFGLFTQIAALLTVVEFLVIVFKKRSGNRFVGGYEFELLILVASVLLATIGGGSVSLDDMFRILLY